MRSPLWTEKKNDCTDIYIRIVILFWFFLIQQFIFKVTKFSGKNRIFLFT